MTATLLRLVVVDKQPSTKVRSSSSIQIRPNLTSLPHFQQPSLRLFRTVAVQAIGLQYIQAVRCEQRTARFRAARLQISLEFLFSNSTISPWCRDVLKSPHDPTFTFPNVDELFDPVSRCLTPEVARSIAGLRAAPDVQKKLDELRGQVHGRNVDDRRACRIRSLCARHQFYQLTADEIACRHQRYKGLTRWHWMPPLDDWSASVPTIAVNTVSAIRTCCR